MNELQDDPSPDERADSAGMVPCYRAYDSLEAALIAGRLESSGIRAVTHDQPAAVAFGDLPRAVLTVDIWVPAGELERALQLVHDHIEESHAGRDTATGFRAPWTCPGCGQTSDAGFDLCWSCQTPRPAGAD